MILVVVITKIAINLIIVFAVIDSYIVLFGSSLYRVLSGLLYRRYLATLSCTWQLYVLYLAAFSCPLDYFYLVHLATFSSVLDYSFSALVWGLGFQVIGFLGVVGLGRQGQNMPTWVVWVLVTWTIFSPQKRVK